MKITYSIRDICDFVGATTAKCQLSLYGRWCDLTITSYCLGDNEFDATGVAMSYGIRPLPQTELECHSGRGMIDGMLSLARGLGGHRQDFEQKVEFPTISGTFFDRHVVSGGGVEASRELISSILRGAESLIETVRLTIRSSFPDDIQDIAIAKIDDRYGEVTKQTVETLFRDLHWRLMLNKSGCDDAQFGCITYMAENNPPRFFSIEEDESDIPLVGETAADVIRNMRNTIKDCHAARDAIRRQAERERRDAKLAVANDRARDLLRSVCGEVVHAEFLQKGYILVKQDGFTFEIKPHDFVRCVDPNGKQARLCIHTRGFQCNPIDEVIIAYLHIKHKLAEYMKLAILHNVEAGFQRMPK